VNRRTFILGAVAAAVSAALPALPSYEYKTYRMAFNFTRETVGRNEYSEIGDRMAKALARSMMQTKERVIADTLNKMFPDSGEGARRSVGVEGSPDRI
jgi:hypothetical protein